MEEIEGRVWTRGGELSLIKLVMTMCGQMISCMDMMITKVHIPNNSALHLYQFRSIVSMHRAIALADTASAAAAATTPPLPNQLPRPFPSLARLLVASLDPRSHAWFTFFPSSPSFSHFLLSIDGSSCWVSSVL